MKPSKISTIEIQPETVTFEDSKTGVKSAGFAIEFPRDGKHGFLVITHLDKRPWNPIEDIKSITIEFNTNNTK